MIPKEKTYPVFEPNQVLKDSHLNDMFEYLNEQQHLTRVNLIGIGIVCGLEMKVAADFSSITISKGCGVTSGGHLIVIPNDHTTASLCSETLTRWKRYTAPVDIAYAPFINKSANPQQQYDLFELFPTGEPDTSPLTSSFLSNMVLLLFVECNLENLKNCSPNSCDDKGQQVTVTIRKLLIRKPDMNKILEEAKTLSAQTCATDIAANLSARLDLMDLRLRRFDVVNSNVDTAEEIMSAYRKILLEVQPGTNLTFLRHVGKALSNAYVAYKPLLESIESTDPFADNLLAIQNQYLTRATNNNIVFSQYFYDFLDDLIQAYEEFRLKGLELMAMCCPPEGLFERHLMIAELVGSDMSGKKVYRHYFSPAMTQVSQAKLAEEVRHLFQRMVLMVQQFSLPVMPVTGQALDLVRITPSLHGRWWLSQKAIPFHYKVNVGSPALYERWSYEKTSQGRAKLNLSYHAAQYSSQPFVLNPLRYNIEPNNFFQIEGHIGRQWRPVVSDLLTKIKQYRLPFDVIALNADNLTVLNDPQTPRCISNDLRIIYNAWLKEAACLWKDMTVYFSSISHADYQIATAQAISGDTIASFAKTSMSKGEMQVMAISQNPVSAVELEFGIAPKATFSEPGTLGLGVVGAVNSTEGTVGNIFLKAYNDPKVTSGAELKMSMIQTLRLDPKLAKLPVDEFNLVAGYPAELMADINDYTSTVPDEIDSLEADELEIKYERVIATASKYYNDMLVYQPSPEHIYFPPQQKDDTLEQLRAILKSCKNDSIKVIKAELDKQDKALKELIFFRNYVQKHPEIQHNAGVPVGGTFILIYSETPITKPTPATTVDTVNATNFNTTASNTGASFEINESVSPASNEAKDLGIVSSMLTPEQLTAFNLFSQQNNLVIDIAAFEAAIINPTISFPEQTKNIPKGVILADFWVPDRCCSDCPPVQFVLPPAPPAFTATPGCTDSNGEALVTINVVHGIAPYQLKEDTKKYAPLPTTLRLKVGPHTLRLMDSLGGESAEVKLEIKASMTVVLGQATCIDFDGIYNLLMNVSNGVLPFLVNGRPPIQVTLKDGKYELLAGPFPGGAEIDIEVSDSSACPPVKQPFKHDCPLPPVPVAGDDMAKTDFNKPVNIDVLHNDTGKELIVSVPPQNTPGTLKVESDHTITFTPDKTVSGQIVSFTYQITDIYGNTDTATVEVTVKEKPCDLPCEGQAERCRYPLWLSKPDKDAIQYRNTEAAWLEIKDKETGANLFPFTDLLKTVFQPLLPAGAIITQADFGKKIKEILEAINNFVAAKLGANTFVLGYDETNGSILTVEHFICHDFRFYIEFAIVQAKVTVSRRWIYDGQLVTVQQLVPQQGVSHEFQVPKFGCVMLNKCEGKVLKEDCRTNLIKDINAVSVRTSVTFTPSLSPPPASKPLFWWMIEWALPPFGKDGTMTTQLLSGNMAKARLLLIDEKGCWDYAEKVIRLNQQPVRPVVLGTISATKPTELPKIQVPSRGESKSVKAPPETTGKSTKAGTAKKEVKAPPETAKKSAKEKPKKGKS